MVLHILQAPFLVFRQGVRVCAKPARRAGAARPARRLDELLRFASLWPLLTAALDRQWCTTVVATDAAPDYGMGVSVAVMPAGTVASLGAQSERHGDHIRLSRDGSAAEHEKPRVGTPHRLNLRQEDFKDVLSIRAHVVNTLGSLN